MNYALNLAEDGRILSVTFEKYAHEEAVVVEELPEGNVSEYRYADGEYIHEPLTNEDQTEEKPTHEERITDLEEALYMILNEVTE